MKKVIIIEDVFKEFERIKSVIDSEFLCPQQYTAEDFDTDIKGNYINKLKDSLKVTCSSQEEYEERDKTIQQLKNDLKKYCNEDDEPVYLIDYKLDGGRKTNSINGIRFKELFLNTMYPNMIIPVLFITSVNHNDKITVEDYVKKIDDIEICNYQTKPDSNNWNSIQNNIRNFISNAQQKANVYQSIKDGIPDDEARKI